MKRKITNSLILLLLTFLGFKSYTQKFTAKTIICEGEDLVLKAEGSERYLWKGPNNFSSTEQNPIVKNVNYLSGGDYFISFISSRDTINMSFRVKLYSKISPTLSFSIAGNNLKIFSGINSQNNLQYSYSWTASNSFSASTSDIIINNFTSKDFGNYVLSVKDNVSKCTNTSNISINSNTPDCAYQFKKYVVKKNDLGDNYFVPYKTALIICNTNEVLFATDSVKNASYQWFRGGVALPNSNAPMLKASQEGNYEVKIKVGNCSYEIEDSNKIFSVLNFKTLNSDISTNVPKTGDKLEGCVGATYFQTKNKIYDNLNYVWLLEGQPIGTIGTQYYHYPQKTGNYQLKTILNDCTLFSDPINFVNNAKALAPIRIVNGVADLAKDTVQICRGSNVRLYSENASYWYRNDTLLANSSFIDVTKSGRYSFKSFVQSCAYDPKKTSVIFKVGNTENAIIKSENVIINATFFGKNVAVRTNIPNAQKYLWNQEFVGETERNSSFVSGSECAKSVGVTNYQVKVLGKDCQAISDKVNINQIPFRLNIIDDNTKTSTILCQGSQVRIHLSEDILRYDSDESIKIIWRLNGVPIKNFNENFAREFYATEAGVYDCQLVSSKCSIISSSYTVTLKEVVKKPKISIVGCEGEKTRIKVENVENINFKWSENFQIQPRYDNVGALLAVDGGVYKVITQSDYCNNESSEIRITNMGIEAPPVISACIGKTIDIFCVYGRNVKWTGPNGFQSSLQTITLADIKATNAGIYTVTDTNPVGCKTSATVEIKTPQQTFSDNPAKSRCEGFYFDSFGDTQSSFIETKWKGPNGFSSTTSDSFMFGLKPSGSGIYTFEYRTLEGCTGKFDRVLEVQPITKIGIDNIEVCGGKKVVKLPAVQTSLFYVWSSPQRITQYDWTGINSFTSTQKTPTIPNFSTDKAGTYSLNVRTISGCKATGTTSVKIKENGKEYRTQNIIYCNGAKDLQLNPPTELVKRNIIAYKWSGPNNFTANESSPIIKVLPNQKLAGTYELTLTTLDSCLEKAQIIVEFNDAITYLNSQKQSFCNQDSIRLTPYQGIEYSNFNTFSWKGPNGFVSNKLNPFLKTKTKQKITGDYELTLTNVLGCLSKTILTVEKNDPISLILPNKNISVCEGASALVDVDTKYTDSTEYAFIYQTEKIRKNSQEDYVIKNHYLEPTGIYKKLSLFDKMDASKEGYYKITAQSYFSGCPVIDSVKVTLNKSTDCKSISLSEINTQPRCNGALVDIPFKITGKFDVNTTYTVYGILAETGEIIILGKGAKSPIQVKIDHRYSSLGINYFIKSSDNIYSGITDYTNYLITVREPYVFVSGDRLACKESKLSFNYYGQSPNEISDVQWINDDKIIEKANGFIYSATITGNYKVNYAYQNCPFSVGGIWDYDGEKEFLTNGYPVKIGEILKPYIYTNNYSNSPYTACEGTKIILFTDSASRSNNPNIVLTHKWKFNNEYIKEADKKNFVAQKSGEYVYEVSENGCTNQSSPFKLLINDNRKANVRLITPYYDLSSGENLVCKGLNSYLNLTEYPPLKNDSLQQKQDKELNIQGKTFQWYRNGELIKNNNSPLLKITESGDYTLRLSEGQCLVYSDNFKVKVLVAMPTILSNYGLTNTCESSFIEINKSSDKTGEYRDVYGQYFRTLNSETTWLKNGQVLNNVGTQASYKLKVTESGNYHYTSKIFYSNNTSCSFISDTVKVKVEGKQFDVSPYEFLQNTQTCRDSVQLYYPYISTDLRPLNYQWKINGQAIPKAINNTLYVKESGSYSLETTYKGGCKSTGLPMKVSMKEISVNIAEYGSRCENESATFYANTNNYYKNSTYQWLKDGKILDNQVASQLSDVKDVGKYAVKVKYNNCEATSKELDFNINKISTGLSPNDSARFCPNNTVRINAAKEKGLIYEWYRDNNLLLNKTTDSILVGESGKYRVLLKRENCSNVSKPVIVYEKLILPSAQISAIKNQIYYGDSTTVKIDLTGDSPWIVNLSDGKIFNAKISPYLFKVNPLKTVIYTLKDVKNNCGIGTVQGEAKIEVLILNNEELETFSLKVYPIPTTSICNVEVELETPVHIKITILDILGRIIMEKESPDKLRVFLEQMDLTNFKEGVYFLNVMAGDKKSIRKIVKY